MKYLQRIGIGVVLFASTSLGMADMSLKLGASFIGWEKQATSGSTYASAERLITDYARQVGHACFQPELFFRSGSTSVLTAELYYDMGLPYGAEEVVLLDSFDQRVALVTQTFRSDVLTVLISSDSGVFLILC